ncbi:DUF4159 domain-containing protein [Bacteroidia bacterium]|jgi:hypothetical protein|nr:DUF4159 domain-containing protein [Bacteroidia bacterium]MDC1519124.1 DUF4159 domain-containing protein [bacterium]|tara:strand:+ start:603 stop:1253 length:651 start_codon:yes stop_codon:yes gene_type:complete
MKNILLLITVVIASSFQTDYSIKIAKLKYDGGGDWYGNRTALPNLAKFCNENLKTSINPQDEVVEAASAEIFNYPYVYMTGHGNVLFNAKDAANMRKYLLAGGFLHIDDNYGLDKYIRPEMKKIFPELDFVELPFNHPIYNQRYNFPKGLPKIHEHDGKPAQGFGLIYKGRLVCLYDYECDLGNGWEDAGIYDDSQEKRTQALQMGANILQYCFGN